MAINLDHISMKFGHVNQFSNLNVLWTGGDHTNIEDKEKISFIQFVRINTVQYNNVAYRDSFYTFFTSLFQFTFLTALHWAERIAPFFGLKSIASIDRAMHR